MGLMALIGHFQPLPNNCHVTLSERHDYVMTVSYVLIELTNQTNQTHSSDRRREIFIQSVNLYVRTCARSHAPARHRAITIRPVSHVIPGTSKDTSSHRRRLCTAVNSGARLCTTY